MTKINDEVAFNSSLDALDSLCEALKEHGLYGEIRQNLQAIRSFCEPVAPPVPVVTVPPFSLRWDGHEVWGDPQSVDAARKAVQWRANRLHKAVRTASPVPVPVVTVPMPSPRRHNGTYESWPFTYYTEHDLLTDRANIQVALTAAGVAVRIEGGQ